MKMFIAATFTALLAATVAACGSTPQTEKVGKAQQPYICRDDKYDTQFDLGLFISEYNVDAMTLIESIYPSQTGEIADYQNAVYPVLPPPEDTVIFHTGCGNFQFYLLNGWTVNGPPVSGDDAGDEAGGDVGATTFVSELYARTTQLWSNYETVSQTLSFSDAYAAYPDTIQPLIDTYYQGDPTQIPDGTNVLITSSGDFQVTYPSSSNVEYIYPISIGVWYQA